MKATIIVMHTHFFVLKTSCTAAYSIQGPLVFSHILYLYAIRPLVFVYKLKAKHSRPLQTISYKRLSEMQNVFIILEII